MSNDIIIYNTEDGKVKINLRLENDTVWLNQLVSGYLDFAERQAEREVQMKMSDWIEHVDKILTATGEDLLEGNGKISHEEMNKKVEIEYKKYHSKTLSQVEKDYLEEIKNIEKAVKNNIKK